MEDFDQGTLQHLSLSSDGRLSVAPRLKEVYDSSTAVLWAVARDSKGNIYTGGGSLGGSRAKLFSIDPQGRGKLLAELDGIAVQAIAIDRQDRVYAATSPDGKVYRVDSTGKAEVFYDPKTKYIWALAFAKNGDLYVATGDRGEIHRVTPAGVGSVFFRTEEAHARSMTIDAADNLIVGTEPSGLIMRVSPRAPQAKDLFCIRLPSARSPRSQSARMARSTRRARGIARIRRLPHPRRSARRQHLRRKPLPRPERCKSWGRRRYPSRYRFSIPSRSPEARRFIAFRATDIRVGSGATRRTWSMHWRSTHRAGCWREQEIMAIYTASTAITPTRGCSSVDPTQITGLLRAPEGQLYAVTGNIGEVLAIGPELEPSGTLESDVLDAGGFSYWGRITKEPEAPSGTVFETRSGNVGRAQRNWSAWAPLTQGTTQGRVASPPARFLQYRATLSGNAELSDVGVAYQMKNVAPVVAEVEITPPNYRFPAPAAISATTAPTPTLILPPISQSPASRPAGGIPATPDETPALTYAKGQIGARWLAEDDNGDALQFKIEIRGANETTWKLLRDKVRERYLSWDSAAYPDGKYVLRVTASDAPSNPPDQALTAIRESDPFLVDNTPPEITWGRAGSLQFHVRDALSTLGKAEYSINGGDWILIEPTTRLTDSAEHDYRVTLPNRPPGEVTVAVRVEDELGTRPSPRPCSTDTNRIHIQDLAYPGSRYIRLGVVVIRIAPQSGRGFGISCGIEMVNLSI